MPDRAILIVEDMASLAMAYAAQLETAGFSSILVTTGEEALAALSSHGDTIGAILLDLQLPDMDGLALLQDRPDIARRWPVIVATADGSISRAIETMRVGAFDFLVKPLAPARLVATIRSALATGASAPIDAPAESEPARIDGFHGFVGMSPPMQAVYREIEKVATSRATVFITGESGTGKEVCAEAIHAAGPRARKPFVAINCGAIPVDLLESELFGHLKGSFTGAVSDRIGAVQAANGGSLFLDEVCEMELKLQVKLLRFLQTGTVQRVGASRPEEVDVRIICATNRHPETEVAEGRFREDLFYRLAVIPIQMPPLRARGHDVEMIANAFLQRFGAEEGKTFNRLSPDVARAIGQHPWPGNVRELQNVMRRVAVMTAGPEVPAIALALPASRVTRPDVAPREAQASTQGQSTPRSTGNIDLLAGMTLEDIERLAIETAIIRANGSLPVAARELGVSPSTLYRKRERWTSQALAG